MFVFIKKRIDAIHKAEEAKCDLAILDDGFQDYSLKKDLNILCFNEKQLTGNGMTILFWTIKRKYKLNKKS